MHLYAQFPVMERELSLFTKIMHPLFPNNSEFVSACYETLQKNSTKFNRLAHHLMKRANKFRNPNMISSGYIIGQRNYPRFDLDKVYVSMFMMLFTTILRFKTRGTLCIWKQNHQQ